MREFAIDLARQAGGFARASFGDRGRRKADGSIVTDADIAINDLVIQRVRERFPNHSVYGEESSVHNDSEFVWVCDPIDGTSAFSIGVPTFVFSLALCRKGIPILGVIYDPMLDRLCVADMQSMTQINGSDVRVSSSDLSGSIVGVVMPNAVNLKALDASIHNYGSIAYMAMLVASGSLSCVIYPGSSGYDVAAAKIIVERAGGRVSSIDGYDQRYDTELNGAVLSNARVHDQVLAKISLGPRIEV